jgi:hypothetical protein
VDFDFDFDGFLAHLSRREDLGQGLLLLKKGDWKNAADKFLAMAEAGDVDLLVFFAVMHEYGKGGPVDRGAAARWYRRAADKGSAFAKSKLAWMHAEGMGVVRDLEAAHALYSSAAETDAAAAYSLGWMHWTGQGAKKNPAEARKWFERAAGAGHALAQCYLGSCYWSAIGTLRDEGKAALWYLRSAKQGNAEAQSHIGHLYADGIGVPRNDVEAYKWLALAAEGAPPERRAAVVEKRDSVAKALPKDRLEEARRRVKAFRPKPEAGASDGKRAFMPHKA